jgi:hypothetical protein
MLRKRFCELFEIDAPVLQAQSASRRLPSRSRPYRAPEGSAALARCSQWVC